MDFSKEGWVDVGGYQSVKTVGERGDEEWVSVGTNSLPTSRPQAFEINLRIGEPAIDDRDAVEVGDQQAVRAVGFTNRSHSFPGQLRHQVRAGPEIRGASGLGDEVLHRSEGHDQQGKICVSGFIEAKASGEGRSETRSFPEGKSG